MNKEVTSKIDELIETVWEDRLYGTSTPVKGRPHDPAPRIGELKNELVSEIASLQQRVQELEKEKEELKKGVDTYFDRAHELRLKVSEQAERLQQLEGEKWISVDAVEAIKSFWITLREWEYSYFRGSAKGCFDLFYQRMPHEVNKLIYKLKSSTTLLDPNKSPPPLYTPVLIRSGGTYKIAQLTEHGWNYLPVDYDNEATEGWQPLPAPPSAQLEQGKEGESTTPIN